MPRIKKTLVYRERYEKKEEQGEMLSDGIVDNGEGDEGCSAGKPKWPQAFGQNTLEGGRARRRLQVRRRHHGAPQPCISRPGVGDFRRPFATVHCYFVYPSSLLLSAMLSPCSPLRCRVDAMSSKYAS